MMPSVDASAPVLEHDWLGACRRATQALQHILVEHPTTHERMIETGKTGEGGDRTLVIDQAAEDAVFEELARLHEGGARFTAVSEERGEVDFGDPDVLVVIDPIDGSANAKRGLTHHAISIAVTTGPTMADVVFGYVFDLGPKEEWRATKGEGAFVNDQPLVDLPPERLTDDGKLEVVAVESAHARNFALRGEVLEDHVHRVRAIGSIAIALCQVAAARCDGMVTLWKSRAVDCAAAQLIVREAGGFVTFPGADGPLGAPLDLEPHFPVVAARTEEGLRRLSQVPG